MRVLLDESVEYRLADVLTHLGHNVTAIAVDYPSALKDQDVLRIAVEEDRVLLTDDKDFGELVFRQRFAHRGVILFRVQDDRIDVKRSGLVQAMQLSAEQLSGFVVTTDRGIRIRSVR